MTKWQINVCVCVCVCACVFVCCYYFLIDFPPKNVDRPNSTYYKLFQSTPKNNYIGHIHHSKYMFRVYRGSAHMGHILKTNTAMLPFYAIK